MRTVSAVPRRWHRQQRRARIEIPTTEFAIVVELRAESCHACGASCGAAVRENVSSGLLPLKFWALPNHTRSHLHLFVDEPF